MGLTEEQTTIIKATVPILQTGGETLTKHFYGIMLKEYAEIVPFFNKAHQASGDQPRALAGAVLMYAKNIDRLQNLGPVASQIVHKHVSLAIRADHYPIVGACLLRAIREVLGEETATDEVINAWAAAYQQLADMLIAAEEKVYRENELAVGGWRGDRAFILSRKEPEAENIVSFYFTPEDNGKVLHYQPGQYTCVHVPDLNGQDTRRNYSLSQCHPGHESEAVYRITVKRESEGVMSNYLHGLSVGDRVLLLPPAGEFVYRHVDENSRHLVLLAGGVGITPIYSMLVAALKASPDRQITFIYCTHNHKQTALRKQLATLAHEHANRLQVHHWYSQDHGRRMNKDDLFALLPKKDETTVADLDAYFVAPKGMMRDIKHYFLNDFGVPAEQVHYEFFGPKAAI
jgi:nitric oxide dioxygenase